MATYDEQGNRQDTGFIKFGKSVGDALSGNGGHTTLAGAALGAIKNKIPSFSDIREKVSPAMTAVAHGTIPARNANSTPLPAVSRSASAAKQAPAPAAKPAAAKRAPVEAKDPNYLRNDQTGATYNFDSAPAGRYPAQGNIQVKQKSPVEQAQSEYEQALAGYETDSPTGALVANKMAVGTLNRAKDIRQDRGATDRAAMSEEGALTRAKIGRDPTEESAARAALLQEQLKGSQERGKLEQTLSDPAITGSARERLLRLYQMKYGSKTPDRDVDEVSKLVSAGVIDEAEGRARLGMAPAAAEGYADGGAIGQSADKTLHPTVMQYGKYLEAAAKGGIQPVPFDKYMGLLQSTRGAMQDAPATFAEGGGVDGYARPKDIGWGGVLSRGVDRMLGAPEGAPAPAPAPVAAPAPELSVEDAAQQEADAALMAFGYADGGAIDVAGRHISGPGTGRSDSIPAVIDGSRPAALSDGEFVIPAHVVKAKGTEFFDKLIAAYNQEGGA